MFNYLVNTASQIQIVSAWPDPHEMSGFEVAGVVLASLPLIVTAIEHYADLVQTIKSAMKYKIELRNLKHSLDAEFILFLDTLECLLDGLIPAIQLEELLKDPASTLWQDDTLNERLQDRLGRSYGAFTYCVNDMKAAIKEFIKRLDLDDQGKVRWTERTGLRLAFKRAGFSLRKRDFDDLLERLQKHNRYLEKFTNRSIGFEPSRRKRKQSSRFQKLGGYAKSVFHALEASLGCDCRGSDGHTALFGLTPRSPRSTSQLSKQQEKIEFHIVVSGTFPKSAVPLDGSIIWQEISLESAENVFGNHAPSQINQCSTTPLEHLKTDLTSPTSRRRKSVRFFEALKIRSSTPSPSSSQNTLSTSVSSSQTTTPSPQSQSSSVYISSMCNILCASSTTAHADCLGYIVDGDRKFFLYPLGRSSVPGKKRWSTISLRHILRSPIVSAPALTPWDRLTLAATIASAVLQLHASPWLESAWNNDDVLFLQRDGERLYKQAFVARKVPNPGQALGKPSDTSIFNETLLALAIALVELSLGPLETLQTPEDMRAGTYANMVTLWRLLENDEIGIVYGPKYQSAVRRCVELAKSSNNLDEQVEQELYDGVVSILEDQAMRKNSAP